VTEGVLADFLSRDGTRIWQASGAVIASRDRAGLRALAAEAEAIRTATAGVPLGGMLRSNATHLDFALRKLAFAAGEACLCGLYPTYDMFDPEQEAARGHVDLLGQETGDWSAVFTLRCRDCGQAFRAVQEFGGHYVTARWEALSGEGAAG
jgi:hypothetical protein